MPKAITTDYEHFADDDMGILPYIAQSVKEVIKENDDEKLQKLIDDIAYVADNLYDLLEEVEAAKTKYDQYRNKMKAIEAAMEEKKNALLAMQEEMRKEFGTDVVEDDAPELVFDSPDGQKVVKFEDEPTSAMSSEMETFLDEMFTMDNIVGKKAEATPSATDEDLLRESGLIFNDEIDEVANAEANVDYESEDVDDYYNDYMDDFGVDVDDGYQALDSDSQVNDSASSDDEFSMPALGSADDILAPPDMSTGDDVGGANDDEEENLNDMFMDILNEDDGFLNIFDEPDGDDDDIDDGNGLDMDIPDDDEYDTIDYEEGAFGTSDDDDDDDDNENATSSPSPADLYDDDDDDDAASGFVDPNFF